MKKLNYIQLILTTVLSALIWSTRGQQHDALSFFMGGMLIWYAFLSWGIGMSLIFRKKYIALAISIIVFKYAILGVIIYWFVHQPWAHHLWFALGVASFVISALIYAIIEAFKKEDDKNVI